MADYSADLNLFGTALEGTVDPFEANRIWWFGPEVLPSIDAEVITWPGFLDWAIDGHGGTLLNPSFEIAESESGVDYSRVPASWTMGAAGGDWESATFGPPYRWAEGYEALWGDNQDALSELDDLHLSRGSFGATGPTATGAESYEREWNGNELAYGTFGTYEVQAGEFGREDVTFEDYDGEWYSRHPLPEPDRELDDSWTGLLVPDLGAICTRLNAMKASFNQHLADLAQSTHKVPDVTNTITSSNASDLASAQTLADELWLKAWNHMTDGSLTWHLAYTTSAEGEKPEDSGFYPTASLANCGTVVAYLTVYLNWHWTWAQDDGRAHYETINFPGADISELNAWTFKIDRISGPDTVENYESKWNGNEAALSEFTPGDLSAGTFEDYAGPATFDSHESSGWPIAVVSTPGSAGAPTDCDPSEWFRVLATGTLAVGTELKVQVRRSRSSTFIDKETVSSIPGGNLEIDVEPGYDAVRLFTVTWGGTAVFEFNRKWRRSATL